MMFLMELERPSVWFISLRVKLVFRTKRYQAQVNMYLDRQTNAVSKKMNELNYLYLMINL